MRDRTHDEAMAGLFAEDPNFAMEYLKEVRENGDQNDLEMALRQIQSSAAMAFPIVERTGVKGLVRPAAEGEDSAP